MLEGGSDILIVETIFDTLNAKAALAGIHDAFEALGVAAPVMISGTITDLSGRTLSGQTPEAFWHSLRHANPLTIGLNCALGAREMRAHLAELSRIADALVCAYPNAGLPNEFGLYDESPEYMAELIGEFAEFRPRQCGRRLLRHDAGAYSCDRATGEGGRAAQDPGDRAFAAPFWP